MTAKQTSPSPYARAARRLVAYALCLALGLCLLAACDESDSGGVVKEYDETEEVTLTLFSSSGLGYDLWPGGVKSADGSTIQIVTDSAEYYADEGLSYRELITKKLEADDGIDIYMIYAEDVIDFEARGLWLDLSPLNAVNSLSADALLQSTYNGKVFSLPLGYTGYGFYWNVDLLRQYGLSVPQNRTEFLQVCEALKANGITPYLGNKGYALTVPAMAVGVAELYASPDREALLADLASGKTPVSAYMLKGFEFIAMMAERGYLEPEFALATAPRAEDRDRFLAGEGAIYCATLGADLEGAEFEYLLTGVPVLEDGAVAVAAPSQRIAVNPHSSHVDEAVVAMEALATPEQLNKFAQERGFISSSNLAGDLSYLAAPEREFAALVQSGGQIPVQDYSLPFNTWESIRDICREILAGMSAADAAAAYDRRQAEEIAAFGAQ